MLPKKGALTKYRSPSAKRTGRHFWQRKGWLRYPLLALLLGGSAVALRGGFWSQTPAKAAKRAAQRAAQNKSKKLISVQMLLEHNEHDINLSIKKGSHNLPSPKITRKDSEVIIDLAGVRVRPRKWTLSGSRVSSINVKVDKHGSRLTIAQDPKVKGKLRDAFSAEDVDGNLVLRVLNESIGDRTRAVVEPNTTTHAIAAASTVPTASHAPNKKAHHPLGKLLSKKDTRSKVHHTAPHTTKTANRHTVQHPVTLDAASGHHGAAVKNTHAKHAAPSTPREVHGQVHDPHGIAKPAHGANGHTPAGGQGHAPTDAHGHAASAKHPPGEPSHSKIQVVEHEVPDPHGDAHDLDAEHAEQDRHGPDNTLLKTALSMGGSVLAFGLLILIPLLWWKNRQQSTPGNIKVLERMALSPKHSLVKVNLGAQTLWLGLSDGNIQVISPSTVSDPRLVAANQGHFSSDVGQPELFDNLEHEMTAPAASAAPPTMARRKLQAFKARLKDALTHPDVESEAMAAQDAGKQADAIRRELARRQAEPHEEADSGAHRDVA